MVGCLSLKWEKCGKSWFGGGGVDQEFDFKHSNFEMSIRHLSGEGKNKDDV